jgi:hypothetical protein
MSLGLGHPRAPTGPNPLEVGVLPEGETLHIKKSQLKSNQESNQIKGCLTYRAFQESWNGRLAGKEEPLGAVGLLALTARVGVVPGSTDPPMVFAGTLCIKAASSAAFFAVAASAAFVSMAAFTITVVTLSAAFFAAAASTAFLSTTPFAVAPCYVVRGLLCHGRIHGLLICDSFRCHHRSIVYGLLVSGGLFHHRRVNCSRVVAAGSPKHYHV